MAKSVITSYIHDRGDVAYGVKCSLVAALSDVVGHSVNNVVMCFGLFPQFVFSSIGSSRLW